MLKCTHASHVERSPTSHHTPISTSSFSNTLKTYTFALTHAFNLNTTNCTNYKHIHTTI